MKTLFAYSAAVIILALSSPASSMPVPCPIMQAPCWYDVPVSPAPDYTFTSGTGSYGLMDLEDSPSPWNVFLDLHGTLSSFWSYFQSSESHSGTVDRHGSGARLPEPSAMALLGLGLLGLGVLRRRITRESSEESQ